MEQARDPRRYRPPLVPIVELDHGRVLASAPAVPALRALGLDTVAGAVSFRGGEVVRQAGTRRTARLATPAGNFYLKVHERAPWSQRWLGWILRSPSPARREWDNLRALRRAWFDVPEMVAVGDAPCGPRLPGTSFLLLREIPGLPLDRLLARGWDGFPGHGRGQARERVIRDVAGMIRRLHGNGFFHRDLYLTHLVVAADERWGRPYLIDLQRVEQRFPPRRRWLVKDLAALSLSAPAAMSRADRLRFLLQYLCKTRPDPLVRRWIREIEARVARMRRHRPRFP